MANGGRVTLAVLVAAVGWARPAGADTANVTIANQSFSPAQVTVTMGPPEPGFDAPHAHVVFFNADTVDHNVTFQTGPALPANSGTIGPNTVPFNAVFTAAGTYTYRCTIHPSMQGRVDVNPLPVVTTTTTTTTTSTTTTTAPPASEPTSPAGGSTTSTMARGRATTTTTRAGATTPTAAPTATTATPTDSSSTTAADTTTTTTEPEADLALGSTDDDDDDGDGGSSGSGPLVAVLVLLAGAGAFVGRTLWLRRRP